MKLAAYLKKHGISHSEFAAKIQSTQASVTRYANGDRIPRPTQMVLIAEATAGEVTAMDFYHSLGEAPAGSGEGAAA